MLPLDSAIRSASAGTTGVAWGVRNVAHFGRGGPGVNPIATAPRFSSEHQLFHPGFFADCSQNHPLDREKTQKKCLYRSSVSSKARRYPDFIRKNSPNPNEFAQFAFNLLMRPDDHATKSR
jgi:hypothetical protein